MKNEEKTFEELKEWTMEIMKFYTFEMYEARHRKGDQIIKNKSYIEESDIKQIACQICDFLEREIKTK